MMDTKCIRCKHNETVICNKCDMFFDEFEPIETQTITNADSCIVRTIEVDSSPITAHLNPSRMVTGTTCQICDEFIPVYEYQHAYPRICNECRKRLKKLLYGESEDE